MSQVFDLQAFAEHLRRLLKQSGTFEESDIITRAARLTVGNDKFEVSDQLRKHLKMVAYSILYGSKP